jgi:hypothetical protein
MADVKTWRSARIHHSINKLKPTKNGETRRQKSAREFSVVFIKRHAHCKRARVTAIFSAAAAHDKHHKQIDSLGKTRREATQHKAAQMYEFAGLLRIIATMLVG